MNYNIFIDQRKEEEIKKILKENNFENHGGIEFPYHLENIRLRYNLNGTKITVGEEADIKQLKKIVDIFDAIEVRTEYNRRIEFE